MAAGVTLRVQIEVVVHIDDVDEFATSEYGMGLDDEDLGTYTLDDLTETVADQLAGFLHNEVNNCNEMVMTMHAAAGETVEVIG